jgi:hypothetical protein
MADTEKLHPSTLYVAVGVNMSDEKNVHAKTEPLASGVIDVLPGDTHAVLCLKAAKLLESMAKDARKSAQQ